MVKGGDGDGDRGSSSNNYNCYVVVQLVNRVVTTIVIVLKVNNSRDKQRYYRVLS